MCQYAGVSGEATKGLDARMEHPSSPRRSGEFSVHFTGGRSAAAAKEQNAQEAMIVRVTRADEINDRIADHASLSARGRPGT